MLIVCIKRVMIQASDLSLADIEFLQSVRDINKSPDKYPETDRSDVPANTASIKRATDLTADQVSYRMGGNQNSRGFEEGKHALIKIYDPVATDTGYAPRAVELTNGGRAILSEAQKIGSRLEGVTQSDLDELTHRIAYVEIKMHLLKPLRTNHPDISYVSTDDIIRVKKSGRSATVSIDSETTMVTVKEEGNVVREQEVEKYHPGRIAETMIMAVTQEYTA